MWRVTCFFWCLCSQSLQVICWIYGTQIRTETLKSYSFYVLISYELSVFNAIWQHSVAELQESFIHNTVVLLKCLFFGRQLLAAQNDKRKQIAPTGPGLRRCVENRQVVLGLEEASLGKNVFNQKIENKRILGLLSLANGDVETVFKDKPQLT